MKRLARRTIFGAGTGALRGWRLHQRRDLALRLRALVGNRNLTLKSVGNSTTAR